MRAGAGCCLRPSVPWGHARASSFWCSSYPSRPRSQAAWALLSLLAHPAAPSCPTLHTLARSLPVDQSLRIFTGQ